MTLKKFLPLGRIIVDHTGMGGRIEDLCSIFISKEVHTLVDILVEAVHFIKRL